jgi:hypothetical protein
MKRMKIWSFTCLIIIGAICHKDIHPFEPKLLSEATIRSAVGELNSEEMLRLEKFLREKHKESITNNNVDAIEKYDKLLKELNKGRFDLVIAEIKKHGEKIQDILKITNLREKMLSGELEKIPWFIREIAGLTWFFEQDAKQSQEKQQWPRPQDKVLYLASLVDQIERNHNRVTDLTTLKNAIDELRTRLSNLQNSVSNVMKRTIKQSLEKLRLVEEIRNL